MGKLASEMIFLLLKKYSDPAFLICDSNNTGDMVQILEIIERLLVVCYNVRSTYISLIARTILTSFWSFCGTPIRFLNFPA